MLTIVVIVRENRRKFKKAAGNDLS